MLHVCLLGQARGRWNAVDTYIQALSDVSSLHLQQPSHLGDEELSFSWHLQDAETVDLALEHLNSFFSFSMDDMFHITKIEK